MTAAQIKEKAQQMIIWLEQNRNSFDKSFVLSPGERIVDVDRYIDVCIIRLKDHIDRNAFQFPFYSVYNNCIKLKKHLQNKSKQDERSRN